MEHLAESLWFSHFSCIPTETSLIYVWLKVFVRYIVIASCNHTAEMWPKALNVVGIYRAIIFTHELKSTVVTDTMVIAHTANLIVGVKFVFETVFPCILKFSRQIFFYFFNPPFFFNQSLFLKIFPEFFFPSFFNNPFLTINLFYT